MNGEEKKLPYWEDGCWRWRKDVEPATEMDYEEARKSLVAFAEFLFNLAGFLFFAGLGVYFLLMWWWSRTG